MVAWHDARVAHRPISRGRRRSGIAEKGSQLEVLALTADEVEAYRADTPGTTNVVHFNHAGASLMSRPVIDATIGHLRREGEIGGYEAADEAEDRLDAVYGSLARLIGCSPNEIAVVENATRGWDLAFYGIPLAAGDRLLTSMSEYASNVIAFLQVAKRGVSVEVIPNDDAGQASVEALCAMLDDRVKIVAISHMPTNGGLVQPVAAIGAALRAAGSDAIYIVDACQSAGQIPLDVGTIGCDVLSATSRKYLRGPRGMGFVYVRSSRIEAIEPPLLDLHAATWTAVDRYEIRTDARRFENWETNVAAKLGFGVAVDYALAIGLDRIWATVRRQAELLRATLAEIDGVTVRDTGATRGGIVTFTVDGADAGAVVAELQQRAINTVSSSRYSTRFDMEARGLTKLVRASVHYLTTDAEIDTLGRAIAQLTR